MVLTFNKKMMTGIPGEEGGEPGPLPDPDMFYENVYAEQSAIGEGKDDIPANVNSLTLNLTNFLSDNDVVMETWAHRASYKEDKGAENLANRKPRYYPAAYVEATKESAANAESNGPIDPADLLPSDGTVVSGPEQ